jgi:hypothetical protein
LRFRTLATDFDGRVGFRGYVGQAALHRVVAGQRVVADDGGKDLSIEVVWRKAAIPCATWVRDGFSCRRPVEFLVNWVISTVGRFVWIP